MIYYDKISNTTIKYAKRQFKSKIVDKAKYLLEHESIKLIYGEFIDDSVMRYLNNVYCL